MGLFSSRLSAAERLGRERPVVVVSRGHSGTRLLAWGLQALGVDLGAVTEVATGDAQDRRFTATISRLARRSLHRPWEKPPTRIELRNFRRAARSYMTWMERNGERWGWKFPETSCYNTSTII